VLFGVSHWYFGDPAELIFPRVALGFAFALLYEYSGSLYPSLALHMWINVGLAASLFPGLRSILGLTVLVGGITAVGMSIRDPRRKKHQHAPPAPALQAERFARTPLDTPESMRRVAAGQ
jgi:hypothetical protein